MPDSTTVLLESDGWDDLATRAEYLQRVEDADAALVGRVRSLRDSVRVQLAAVEHTPGSSRRPSTTGSPPLAIRSPPCVPRPRAGPRRSSRRAPASRRRSTACRPRSATGRSAVQHLEQVSAEQAQSEVDQWFGDWAIPESIVQCESGRQLRRRQPELGRRRRVPDPALDLGPLRRRGPPRGRLARRAVGDRLADLGRLGRRRLGVRSVGRVARLRARLSPRAAPGARPGSPRRAAAERRPRRRS